MAINLWTSKNFASIEDTRGKCIPLMKDFSKFTSNKKIFNKLL